MGILQTQNELADLIGEEKIKFEDPRSVKQMLRDSGEWTKKDDEELNEKIAEEMACQQIDYKEQFEDYQSYADAKIDGRIII